MLKATIEQKKAIPKVAKESMTRMRGTDGQPRRQSAQQELNRIGSVTEKDFPIARFGDLIGVRVVLGPAFTRKQHYSFVHSHPITLAMFAILGRVRQRRRLFPFFGCRTRCPPS